MQANSRKILAEWEDEVTRSLVEGFRQLFESSSQVLLEFADAAENNRLQRLFFDAQREFYLKEEAMVGEFERGLRANLSSFSGTQANDKTPGADTLSLVEVEDYERSLALETIAKRMVDKNLGELHALAQRLSALLGGRPLSMEQIPANPMQVIRVFDPASRKLEVEKEVRLVFYTLFDRYVMSRLGKLYKALNGRLVDIGILPNIKFDYQRHGPGSGTAPSESAEQAPQATSEDVPVGTPDTLSDDAPGATQAGDTTRSIRPATPTSAETLSAISSLLMAKRQKQAESEPPLQTSAPIMPTAANVDEAIADDRVLQEAPHPLPLPSGAAGLKVAVDPALLLKVKKALEKQRQIIKRLVGKDKLDRKEEDVIDIVGMLFEAMLNEKLLPNAVKTLLSHLHTRYLKIAVQSPNFLDNTSHPARRLFERMLDAGIRWVREDNLRAGIFPQLQNIVTDILGRENLDEEFLLEQIALLDKAEKKLERQSSAAEDRTLEAERGRARLDQAKDLVKKTVDDMSSEIEVSPEVRGFLSTTYADFLTLLLLRNDLDTESDAWNSAYSVGEALIAAAVYSAKGQPLGQEVRNDLIKRLDETVGSLIPHHAQNIRRVVEALGPEAAEKTPVAEEPPSPAPLASATEPPAMTEPEPEIEEDIEPEVPVSADDQKVSDKLMREAGNWFVMQNEEHGEQAVKLLWVNPHTRNMLFVDQHGAKVALMPAGTVAHRIRDGSVRPMRQETSSFVSRSLRRIRRALEDSVNA
jgi:hypothetical protein